MNAVQLIGNAGQDANIVKFEGGQKANFTLATNETYKQDNKEVKNTTWHNVIAWGKLAEECNELIKKGKLIKVEGKINYRNYTNKENQKVYLTEIVARKIEEVKGK